MLGDQIKSFSEKVNPIPRIPIALDRTDVDMIRRFVDSELDELEFADTMVDQADAIADAIYFLYDCAARFGLDMDAILQEVHKANLRKIVDGKVVVKDGKVQKPKGWYGPEEQIQQIIKRTKNARFQ